MNHPIHAIFVHFPAGLIPMAVFFFLIFLYTKRAYFERISITLLSFSLLFLTFAIITGLYDWYVRYLHLIFPVIIIKLFLSMIAVLLIILIWNIRNKYLKNNNISALSKAYGYIFLNLLLFPIVAVIGFFGGNLVYPADVNNHGDMIKIGSAIYIERCSACHPYGQGIFDPLIFPGSKDSFGSASILQSELLFDKEAMRNYIRNPKRMPVVSIEKLTDNDFEYVYKYLNYLKFGDIKKEMTDSVVLDKDIFSDLSSSCHKNFELNGVMSYNSILLSPVLQNSITFTEFLKKKKNRINNSEMPLFDSTKVSDKKIINLYNYLKTKISSDPKKEIISSIVLDNNVFKDLCSDCHENFEFNGVAGYKSILLSPVLNSKITFTEFLRERKHRVNNSEMPLFDSTQVSDKKIISLYNYLKTKKK